MLSEVKFQTLIMCFGLKSFCTGCLLFGGFYLLADAAWLGLLMMFIGCCVGKQTFDKQYSQILEHSRAQTRAIDLLTRQLTSDEKEPML